MLEVQLLGHLAVADSGHRIDAVRNPRLLAYLLLNRDRAIERTEVAFTLWPDSSDAQALTNLRRELHALRRGLPNAERLLAIERRTIRWRPDGSFHLDIAAFEDAVERAAGGGVGELRSAVALYRGDLLPGVYDDWIQPHRDRLRMKMVETLDALAAGLEDRREYRAAMEQLRRLVAIDPLDESRYQALMRVAAFVGDRTAGLRAYHACASALRDELGIEPSRETLDAYQRLRTLEMSQLQAPAASGVPVQPELVGRDPEWKALVDGWNAAPSGALTLVLIEGDAGIGKTRLIEEFSRWVKAQGAAVLTARSWAVEGSLAYAPSRPGSDRRRCGHFSTASTTSGFRRSRVFCRSSSPIILSWRRLRRCSKAGSANACSRPSPGQWRAHVHGHCSSSTMRTGPIATRSSGCTSCFGQRPSQASSSSASGRGRPGATRPWRRSCPTHEIETSSLDIELGPLSEAETAALAAATSDRPLDAAAHARLYHETEGHPLFVVEMARSGLAGSAEPDAAGAAGERTPPVPARMTARMRAVIAARLRKLTPTAQRVAELAAAIGRDFDVDVLAASADLDEPDLVEGLDELWRRRIIREHGLNRYDFSHDRIREVAYDQIAPAGRRMLHRRVAQALELRHHDDLDPVAAQLAAQLESAGFGTPRLRALRACGQSRGTGPGERRGNAAPLPRSGDPDRVTGEPGPRRPRAAPAASVVAVTPRDRGLFVAAPGGDGGASSSPRRGPGRGARRAGRTQRPVGGARRRWGGGPIKSGRRGRAAAIGGTSGLCVGDATWRWVDHSRSSVSTGRRWSNSSGRSRRTCPGCRGRSPRGPTQASAPFHGDHMPCGSRVERRSPRSGRAGRSPWPSLSKAPT